MTCYLCDCRVMAAVARGHGGDAGGDPPPDPSRIPASCETGNLLI